MCCDSRRRRRCTHVIGRWARRIAGGGFGSLLHARPGPCGPHRHRQRKLFRGNGNQAGPGRGRRRGLGRGLRPQLRQRTVRSTRRPTRALAPRVAAAGMQPHAHVHGYLFAERRGGCGGRHDHGGSRGILTRCPASRRLRLQLAWQWCGALSTEELLVMILLAVPRKKGRGCAWWVLPGPRRIGHCIHRGLHFMCVMHRCFYEGRCNVLEVEAEATCQAALTTDRPAWTESD